jgi:hypothetical protein
LDVEVVGQTTLKAEKKIRRKYSDWLNGDSLVMWTGFSRLKLGIRILNPEELLPRKVHSVVGLFHFRYLSWVTNTTVKEQEAIECAYII